MNTIFELKCRMSEKSLSQTQYSWLYVDLSNGSIAPNVSLISYVLLEDLQMQWHISVLQTERQYY